MEKYQQIFADWINGNLSDVLKRIKELPPIEAAYIGAYMPRMLKDANESWRFLTFLERHLGD